MADQKISQLSFNAALSGLEVVPIVQNGGNRKLLVSDLVNLSGVQTVNGQSGIVSLDATDVGAVAIGSGISQLTNDAGYITANTATTLTGDVTGSGTGSFATTIGVNKVTDAMLRQSAGLSILGKGTNGIGNVADITAGSDNSILRRVGASLGFGSIDLSSSNAVGASILGIANGGSGLNALGGANRLLGVNNAGNAAEYKALTMGTTAQTNDIGWVLTGANSIVLHVPDASATVRGALTAGAQVIGGQKTFGTAPILSGFSAGSVLFAGASGVISQDNANFKWDDANNNLGIGTATPTYRIHAAETSNTEAGIFYRNTSAGTAASAQVRVQNNTGEITDIGIRSSVYTGGVKQGYLRTNGDELVIVTSGVAAPIKFFTNSVEIARITTLGLYVGGASNPTSVLHVAGSSTARSAFSIDSGVAPSAPVNGNIWHESNHLYARLNGVTYQLDQQSTGIGLTDGDKGDITVASSGLSWTIDNGTVTLAKMANMTGPAVIGRSTGSGAPTAISAITDNHVLRRIGGSLTFGTIELGSQDTVGVSVLNVANGGTGMSVAGEAGQYLITNQAGGVVWSNVLVEDVTGTTYLFTANDNGKFKRFTNVSGCTATVPVGLSLGWNVIAYRAQGAGVVLLASNGTYEGSANNIAAEKQAASIYHRGGNIHVAFGALGSINGSVTSVGLSPIAGFISVSSSPVVDSGTLTMTLVNQNANVIFAGPSSGASAAPTWRSLVLADMPNHTIEDVTGTTYTFVSDDNHKIKRFTNSFDIVATIPLGLPVGWETFAYRGDGAGAITIVSLGTYEGASNVLSVQKTGASIIHRGSNIHISLGAFLSGGGGGSFVNTATVNEMMKSDGTNGVPSGIFSTANGNINLGSASIAGSRTIAVVSSTANASLTLASNSGGSVILDSGLYYYLGATTNALNYRAIAAQGSLADINLQLFSKGAGYNEYQGSAHHIKDSSGNVMHSFFSNGNQIQTARNGVISATTNYSIQNTTQTGTGTVLVNWGYRKLELLNTYLLFGQEHKAITVIGGSQVSDSQWNFYGQSAGSNPTVDDAGVIMSFVSANRNIAMFTNSTGFGGGVKVMKIGNATTVPTSNPTGGGILYVEAGALKYRGSSGTVSIICPA